MRSLIVSIPFFVLPFIDNYGQPSGYFESTSDIALYAKSSGSYGIYGESASGIGVRGSSQESTGVSGSSYLGKGVEGISLTNTGVYGLSGNNAGGYFICSAKSNPDLIIGGNANNDDCIIASEPSQSGSDLFLRANDAVVIELDKDQSENGQFEIRNGDGTILFTVNETGNPITTATGAYLSTGGMWTNNSSGSLKNLDHALDPDAILPVVANLSLYQWEYKAEPEIKHLGPTAEEFYKLFNCGDSEQHLAASDMAAVALVAIQALINENQILRQEIQLIKQNLLHSTSPQDDP